MPHTCIRYLLDGSCTAATECLLEWLCFSYSYASSFQVSWRTHFKDFSNILISGWTSRTAGAVTC